jgi:hypothetical protein
MNAEQDNSYQGRPLTDELGTARNIRMTGEIDIRKSTNIPAKLVGPLAGLLILADDDPAIEEFVDDVLHLQTSVEGRRVRELLRGESVRKGIGTDISSEIPKRPNPLARYTYDREGEERFQNWKKETQIE